MRKTAIVFLTGTLALSACGSAQTSRLNPFNWLGATKAEAPAPENTNPLIPKAREGLFAASDKDVYLGTPVAQVTDLIIEAVPGGAIIRATGSTPAKQLYDVQLTPDQDAGDGILAFRLEGRSRPGPSQPVTAAVRLSDRQLRDVRIIRVNGAQNALVSRR